MLDWCVEKFFYFGKSDDFVEPFADFPFCHSENRSVEKNVLPSGKFGVKARTNLEQAGDPSLQQNAALGRLADMAQDLEQSAFAGAVTPNDPEDLTSFDFK